MEMHRQIERAKASNMVHIMYRKNSHDEYIAYFICRKKTGVYKVWDPPPPLKQTMTGFKIKLQNVLC